MNQDENYRLHPLAICAITCTDLPAAFPFYEALLMAQGSRPKWKTYLKGKRKLTRVELHENANCILQLEQGFIPPRRMGGAKRDRNGIPEDAIRLPLPDPILSLHLLEELRLLKDDALCLGGVLVDPDGNRLCLHARVVTLPCANPKLTADFYDAIALGKVFSWTNGYVAMGLADGTWIEFVGKDDPEAEEASGTPMRAFELRVDGRFAETIEQVSGMLDDERFKGTFQGVGAIDAGSSGEVGFARDPDGRLVIIDAE